MNSTRRMVSLVAVLALAILTIASASASGITGLEVSGVDVLSLSKPLSVSPGQTVPVRVIFSADSDSTDVRVKAWIAGNSEYSASTDRFVVLSNSTYSKLLSVQMPSKVDPSEVLTLKVLVEGTGNTLSIEKPITLTAQRDSYVVEVLDVAMDSEAKAGESVAVDIVLKNRGSQFAEDTFVKVSVPALGVEKKAYLGDLSPVDQSNPDKEDAVAGRLYLNLPANAPAGVYLVEIEAYNADSSATATKKLSVVGSASGSSLFVSSGNSKDFAVGEVQSYGLTLVNSGNKIRVYEMVTETPGELKLSVDNQVVIVPAGASQPVKFDVTASKAGKYNFAVSIYSDGELVKKYNFGANVEGSAKGFAGNATVILTVVLAVIFVVLLVVLIVLLTRKPEKAEEFGESYY